MLEPARGGDGGGGDCDSKRVRVHRVPDMANQSWRTISHQPTTVDDNWLMNIRC